jgi:hypothetical protein
MGYSYVPEDPETSPELSRQSGVWRRSIAGNQRGSNALRVTKAKKVKTLQMLKLRGISVRAESKS